MPFFGFRAGEEVEQVSAFLGEYWEHVSGGALPQIHASHHAG
jgi:hypothetical protein